MSSIPLTVTELTARIKQVLEQGFAQVEVTGEISRLTSPSSGHLYFTIKDAHAAISAVVWRTTATRLKARPMEGQAYVFIGHLSLYEPRGTYQLIVQHIQTAGSGQLAAEFERRKQLMADNGWFNPEHKLAIPKLPKHIGIVTSPTAAAFEDVKKVLATRPGWIEITLSPCLVQGEQAAKTIVVAIEKLLKQSLRPDVILLVRGGGSIEDLWCFNDESIVKAIFDADIPIITGIGHEIDTTLADLAADIRAATPSNAAELACPARQTLRQQLPQLSSMASLLKRRLQHARQQTGHLVLRQQQASHRFQDKLNWALERLSHKHRQTYRLHNQALHKTLHNLNNRLQQHEPNQLLRQDMLKLHNTKQKLVKIRTSSTSKAREALTARSLLLLASQQKTVRQMKQSWLVLHEQLQAMSPRLVLQRGYAMTTDLNGNVISSAHALHQRDIVELHFQDGTAKTQIIDTKISGEI